MIDAPDRVSQVGSVVVFDFTNKSLVSAVRPVEGQQKVRRRKTEVTILAEREFQGSTFFFLHFFAFLVFLSVTILTTDCYL